MELISLNANYNFVGRIKTAITISLILICLSFLSVLFQGGLNLGIDFAGGTLVQIKFPGPTPIDKIRASLKPINLEGSIIQTMGTDEVVVRVSGAADLKDLSARVSEALGVFFGKDNFEVRRVEYVGPKVGKDLRNKAIMAILFSWIGMLIYITWRFEFRHALGGILALIHDVIITIGVLSLLGREFNLVIVAAILTVIGYSINDTIVIFDRIRETARKDTSQPIASVINKSINQTLSRTILTSLTVLIVVVVLALFGGAVIRDFAITLIVGVIVGTYSSIFVASPVILFLDKRSGGPGGRPGLLLDKKKA
ncbi:MAG: protein translocase subunit SecF [Smithellaceae bacterium]|nr:protein translocase subunit SecF [Smithellaceae bacterium]